VLFYYVSLHSKFCVVMSVTISTYCVVLCCVVLCFVLLFVFVLCFVFPMLPFSLCCSFLISTSGVL
jgi:hypothetical protein